jgi:hypothetical protein
MHTRHLEFKIDQLYKEKTILALESIAVFVGALFITVYLPQLLFQFYYVNQELTAEPEVIKFIPVVSFAVAILFFVYAQVMMIMKKLKIGQLSKEHSLAMLQDDGCNCDHDHGHEHHSDWMNESMDEEVKTVAVSKPKKKAAAKKKTAKKA